MIHESPNGDVGVGRPCLVMVNGNLVVKPWTIDKLVEGFVSQLVEGFVSQLDV